MILNIFKSRSRCQTPIKNIQHHPKPQMRTQRTWIFFAPSNFKRAKIRNIGVSKTPDHIQIKIKMPTSSVLQIPRARTSVAQKVESSLLRTLLNLGCRGSTPDTSGLVSFLFKFQHSPFVRHPFINRDSLNKSAILK